MLPNALPIKQASLSGQNGDASFPYTDVGPSLIAPSGPRPHTASIVNA